MTNRRRLIIITSSVTLGTIFAALILRQRYGALNPVSFSQLFINFLFAIAIVVGIGFLFNKMKKDEEKGKNNQAK